MQIPNSLKSALTCLFAVTLFFAGSWNATAQVAESAVPLAGHTPQQVLDGTAIRIGHYTPEQKLRLALAIQPPHMAEEQQFLTELTTKGSPNFHKFLSAEEWNARFAPAPEDEQKVVDWAVSQGFTVNARYNHRLAVDVEAPAGVIEKAFGVTINTYQIPPADGLDSRTVYSNDRDPEIPSSLSGIVFAVLGLNSIEVARPAAGHGNLAPRPDYVPGPAAQVLGSASKDANPEAVAALAQEASSATSVTPPKSGYYTPSNMFSSNAYDYGALMGQGHCCNPLGNANNSPKESSIAIASFADVSFSDLTNFQAEFSYLAYNVQKIGIDGTYVCGTNDDGCGEVTMDTEWSLAMANSEGAGADTAKVYVYEGSGYTNAIIMDVYNNMLDNGYARVMSTSWGIRENEQYSSNPEMDTYNATMQAVDNVFSSMTGQGWTLVAASGDEGAAAGCGDLTAVQFPSADPNVVAAGGTELSEGNPYEVAWTGSQSTGACDSNGGGSTGGVSEYFPTPNYQSGMGYAKRAVPDLSLDSYYGHDVYLNGGWAYLAGTSVAAPMLAGFFAQENAYLLAIGDKCGSGSSACAPQGNPLPFLYTAGRTNDNAHNPFYDMVSGCNSNDITTKYSLTYYCAGTGYDLVTGWGSANMLQLAWAINWQLIPASGVPYVSFTGPAINTWYNTNQTVNWKIVDYEPNSFPGTGIAGETQGWDSIPADPTSEPHGGSGNSFYSGPQFTNDSTGCLAFSANGCSGNGGAQGCHTVHVQGWNNQGQTTGDATYGPLCYDTVAPVSTAALSGTVYSGTIYKSAVKVTLSATDTGGSGVKYTYYQVDGGGQAAYSGAFTVSALGSHTVKYWSVDVAGNVETAKTTAFSIYSPTTASLVATPNPSLVGQSVKMTATIAATLSGTPTGSVIFYNGATNLGTGTLSGGVAVLSTTALPAGALTLQASYAGAGNYLPTNSAPFDQTVGVAPSLTSPASSPISGSTNFTWNPGTGSSMFALWIGTTPNTKDVYASGHVANTVTSETASIPANGATLYVSLWYELDGVWAYRSYTFTEAQTPSLTSPASSPISGSTNFTWNPGTGSTMFALWVGTTPNTKNVYASGHVANTVTSETVSIPANGATLYVSLWYELNGVWAYKSYTFTEAQTPSLTSPTSSPISGSTNFTWNPGTGSSMFALWVGTTPNTKNVYASGHVANTVTSETVNIPANGATLYVSLWYELNGNWTYKSYTFTEAP